MVEILFTRRDGFEMADLASLRGEIVETALSLFVRSLIIVFSVTSSFLLSQRCEGLTECPLGIHSVELL